MVMKRIIYTVFVAFVASSLTIALLSALTSPPEQAAAQQDRRIPWEEVKRHKIPSDCWMVIEGIVYDFTAYIPLHPTRPEVMTDWCGKEATEAFNTKGYGRRHSPAAEAMLQEYWIGVLKK